MLLSRVDSEKEREIGPKENIKFVFLGDGGKGDGGDKSTSTSIESLI